MTAPIQDSPDSDNVVPENELTHRRRVVQLCSDIADVCKDAADRMAELADLGVPTADWCPLVIANFPDDVRAKLSDPTTMAMVPLSVDLFANYLRDGSVPNDPEKIMTMGTGLGTMLGEGLKSSRIIDLIGAALPLFMNNKNPEPMLSPQYDINAPDSIPLDHEAMYGLDSRRMKAVIQRLFADAPKLTTADGAERTDQATAIECHVVLKAGQSMAGALSITAEGTLRLLSPNVIGKPPNERMIMVEHFFDFDQLADIAIVREMTAETAEADKPRIYTG